ALRPGRWRCARPRPPVCLDVMAVVASSCGYERGESAPRVAQSVAVHGAPPGGPAVVPHTALAPPAQTATQVPRCQGGCAHQAPPSQEGQPWDRTWEEP